MAPVVHLPKEVTQLQIDDSEHSRSQSSNLWDISTAKVLSAMKHFVTDKDLRGQNVLRIWNFGYVNVHYCQSQSRTVAMSLYDIRHPAVFLVFELISVAY